MKEELIIKWHWTDIREHADDRGIKLSKEQCSDILLLLERRHDCEVGINWDVIYCITDMYLEGTHDGGH